MKFNSAFVPYNGHGGKKFEDGQIFSDEELLCYNIDMDNYEDYLNKKVATESKVLAGNISRLLDIHLLTFSKSFKLEVSDNIRQFIVVNNLIILNEIKMCFDIIKRKYSFADFSFRGSNNKLVSDICLNLDSTDYIEIVISYSNSVNNRDIDFLSTIKSDNERKNFISFSEKITEKKYVDLFLKNKDEDIYRLFSIFNNSDIKTESSCRSEGSGHIDYYYSDKSLKKFTELVESSNCIRSGLEDFFAINSEEYISSMLSIIYGGGPDVHFGKY